MKNLLVLTMILAILSAPSVAQADNYGHRVTTHREEAPPDQSDVIPAARPENALGLKGFTSWYGIDARSGEELRLAFAAAVNLDGSATWREIRLAHADHHMLLDDPRAATWTDIIDAQDDARRVFCRMARLPLYTSPEEILQNPTITDEVKREYLRASRIPQDPPRSKK